MRVGRVLTAGAVGLFVVRLGPLPRNSTVLRTTYNNNNPTTGECIEVDVSD